MSEIDLVRPTTEAMQSNKQRLLIFRPNALKLLIRKIRSPRWEPRMSNPAWILSQALVLRSSICSLGARVLERWRYSKVYGEVAWETLIFLFDNAAFVVDGRSALVGGRPEGLQVTVEEERVEIAFRNDVFDQLWQCSGWS
jgi:hypothetical protein